jgi:Phospholipase_D-nuclease N-terminal
MIAATTATWVFILIPLIVIWLLGIVDIVRRDLSRGTKAAWILIVVLLPVLGTILYYLMRKPSDKEIAQAQAAREDLKGDWQGVNRRLPGE